MMINKTQADILKSAVAEFGESKQLDMLQEECLELALAISKVRRRGGIDIAEMDGFFEELADVKIMLFQMDLIFGGHLTDSWIEHKINRLEARLKKVEKGKECTAERSDSPSP